MVKKTDAELFSVLIKRGTKADILKIPDVLVMEDDAREIMQFLKRYASEHRGVPSKKILRRETGFKCVDVTENVSYYADRARKRLLYTIWTGINPQLIKRGRLSTDAHGYMVETIEGIPDMPEFRIMAGNFRKSVGSLRAAAEEMEPDEIDADASYLIQPDTKANNKASRRENAADTIEGLKMLALDLDRPVKQSVQFNRSATKPKSSGSENTNPVAHLGLDKIGETDVIGQSSSIVAGIEVGDPPHSQNERYIGILKGREGEFGWMKINYRFQPANFSQITTSAEANRAALTGTRPVDLSHMDTTD